MFKNNKMLKYVIYGVIALVFVVAINYSKSALMTKKLKYNEFKEMISEKQIEKIVIADNIITITPTKDSEYYGKSVYVIPLNDDKLIEELDSAGVDYEGKQPEAFPILDLLLYWVGPFILLFFLSRLMFGKMDKKMGGGVMSFGKNTAKLYAEDETGITFENVAGQEEAKESLKEIVDFLHKPERYTQIGARLPKGALLVGPPGTGKTLLAKAVAGEAKVPFFSLSGSDFVEMFVGMGASRVRDLFRQAEEKAPCIIFIDEIDAIGKSREGNISGNDEREQTLNQLLAEMDGFDSSKGVVILAATNRPEILDKALLRPGRFDRRVIVDRPDLIGRESILRVHSKDVKLSSDVNIEAIAKSTPGAVGADLANIVNEAALRAVKHKRAVVSQEDLEEAVEVIIAGKEKKDRILSPMEKKIVAFHEVGHALVAALLKNTDPVHKITIVPRTMGALGYTMQLPEEEKYLVSKDEMLDQITVMLGGRAAEEVEFNIISTGASNDIERATQSARSMVSIYGMTETFDMMALENVRNRYLDGRSVANCSEQTLTRVDEETLKIIKACHKKAIELLENNKELLADISNALLEKETLMGDEFMEFIFEKYPELRAIKEEKDKERQDREKAKKAVYAKSINSIDNSVKTEEDKEEKIEFIEIKNDVESDEIKSSDDN
ncbi:MULTISPECIES: ATP-dependent zinc metalloprotease FtsH [Clostridium]|uniref:ATP-dependent zinc metalloprotease FtsH n=1 Tax=Clostridium intestinale DSM 6191 TaxID=1121320 RepID=A0A1M5ZHU5_9CLOT|nr:MULTISPECIES: ATP-dependent zinc metalloprotease FtsH [Clostridium]SHI23796.1 membrane protease FtsH catalytic subunit [Clostridium intestinale DSM 6191]